MMLSQNITSTAATWTSHAARGAEKAFQSSRSSATISFEDCYNTIREKEQIFKTNPSALDQEWTAFFSNSQVPPQFVDRPETLPTGERPDSPGAKLRNILPIILRSYQIRGHLIAETDPLKLPLTAENRGRLWNIEMNRQWNPDKIIETLCLTDGDLDMPFEFELKEINPHMTGFLSGALDKGGKVNTLRGFIRRCHEVYCGSIGYEFTHIQDPKKLKWLVERIEIANRCYQSISKVEKKRLLKSVIEAQGFEDILQKKFPTTKRFGLDGVEAMVPFLQEVTNEGASDEFVLGMAHRGRLNVLSNVFHKPLVDVFREFKGTMGFGGSEYGKNGDVKYHLGVDLSRPHDLDEKRMQRYTLLCNPSHLETVDPVVLGSAKSRQDKLVIEENLTTEEAQTQVLPIMIHGDSAVSGQGIVYEVAQMQNIPVYNVGGTLHIISNNQIGFTTSVSQYLSSRYCTDVFRGFDSPVFHVNGDDLEAVKFIAKLAIDYRNEFKSDVVVDLIGYRRNGHNEQDMPGFTNPQMYSMIAKQPRITDIYSSLLIEEGSLTKDEANALRSEVMGNYEAALAEASQATEALCRKDYSISPEWAAMKDTLQYSSPQVTGLPESALQAIGENIFNVPKGFTPHPTIKKIMDARKKAMKDKKGIDFGTAEALAFGSLLSDGKTVRVVGQDAQRGTFSHRHAVIHDNVNFKTWSPLADLVNRSPLFTNANSHLSEYGALGFEVGYAFQHPDNLTIWEAQFGDFANGAQIMIDTVIAAAEVKWGQQSGLCLYLPHGYDGMGPEHSSCRIERFLSLCDNREDIIDPVNFDPMKRRIIQTSNMQVIIPTTPANLYHALKRQMKREFRKPLVVVQSKKLLKARVAQSALAEMGEGTMFQPFIKDSAPQEVNESVERLILCAGQFYYDLDAQRKKLGGIESTKTAIARVEQLCPLPYGNMLNELQRYPNLKSVVWAQEESMNAGAWTYMNPRIQTLLLYSNAHCVQPLYIGRTACASTATGCPKIHAAESAKILKEAFNLELNHHSSKAFFVVDGDGVTMKETVVNPTYYQHTAKL